MAEKPHDQEVPLISDSQPTKPSERMRRLIASASNEEKKGIPSNEQQSSEQSTSVSQRKVSWNDDEFDSELESNDLIEKTTLAQVEIGSPLPLREWRILPYHRPQVAPAGHLCRTGWMRLIQVQPK